MKLLSAFLICVLLSQLSFAGAQETRSVSSSKRRAIVLQRSNDETERLVRDVLEQNYARLIVLCLQVRQEQGKGLLKPQEELAIRSTHQLFVEEMKNKIRDEPFMREDTIRAWAEFYNKYYLDYTANKDASFLSAIAEVDKRSGIQALLKLDLNVIQQQLSLINAQMKDSLSFFAAMQLLCELNCPQYRDNASEYIALVQQYMTPSLWDSEYSQIQFLHDLLITLKPLRDSGFLSTPGVQAFLEMMTHVKTFRPQDKLGILQYFSFFAPSPSSCAPPSTGNAGVVFAEQLIRLQGVDKRLLNAGNIIHVNKMRFVLDVIFNLGSAYSDKNKLIVVLQEQKFQNLLKSHYFSCFYWVLIGFLHVQKYPNLNMATAEALEAVRYMISEKGFSFLKYDPLKFAIALKTILGLQNKKVEEYRQYIDRLVEQYILDCDYYDRIMSELADEHGLEQAELMVHRHKIERIAQIMEVPLGAPIPPIPGSQDVDIHTRDQKVAYALRIFMRKMRHSAPPPDNEMPKTIREFLDQVRVDESIQQTKRHLFEDALRRPKKPGESYGPLMDEIPFSIVGFKFSGLEFVDFIWRFIRSLPDPLERKTAAHGLVSALADSFEYDAGGKPIRVCNQGKIQRILVAVVQGRMKGIQIDDPEVSLGDMPKKEQAAVLMNSFFREEKHQTIETWEELKVAADLFMTANPQVKENQKLFWKSLREYAATMGMLEEDTQEKL